MLSQQLKSVGTSAFMQFKGAGVDAAEAMTMMDKYIRLAADGAAAYNMSVDEADDGNGRPPPCGASYAARNG